MLIKKNDRKLIHQYLFEEGVVVAKKDYNLAKHPHINVKNLEVIKALQSLTSKGYVKTQFSWQYYYYSLTDEGIEYLRDYLHLPAEIVPRTFLKTATKPAAGQRQGKKIVDHRTNPGEVWRPRVPSQKRQPREEGWCCR